VLQGRQQVVAFGQPADNFAARGYRNVHRVISSCTGLLGDAQRGIFIGVSSTASSCPDPL
jgi:hypothetical protein